jgi:hypothetical protein
MNRPTMTVDGFKILTLKILILLLKVYNSSILQEQRSRQTLCSSWTGATRNS